MTKIQGKFYPLQHLEWLRACKELKPAERDILYYIRTLDPHSDGIEISTSAIAADLSTSEKQVHRQTISRALKRLDELGFIDLEVITAKVNIKPKGLWCDQTPMVSPHTTMDRHTPSADHYTPEEITTHPARITTHPQKSPEPNPGKASSDLPKTQTYKTYKDFKDSLSEEERESFESFCRNEVAALPRPVVSLQDYLAAGDASGQPRYLDFYRRFTGTAAAAQIRTQQAADALTEELYQQFDREFRAMDCEYMDFVKDCPHKSPEWELRVKFLEEWDRRNNAVPLL